MDDRSATTVTPADPAATDRTHPRAVTRARVVVVMPAYNAELTVERTLRDIPAGVADEVILVDDCSRDRTVEVARALGLTVITHDRNTGYGGNQKTCYRAALEHGADIVVMLHPDYQYDSRVIPHVVGFVRLGICDVMFGSRIRTRKEALAGGMPLLKYVLNRLLTLCMNVVLGQNLGECHSGFRVYSRAVLETIVFERNSDDFAFDAELLAQAVYHGFRLGDAPMPVRYFSEASSIGFRDGAIYTLKIFRVLAAYVGQRMRLRQSPLFLRKR